LFLSVLSFTKNFFLSADTAGFSAQKNTAPYGAVYILLSAITVKII